ncbi:MAG: GNAT family N-acetyltransferase [Jatrophihabitantaceae bacterium]
MTLLGFDIVHPSRTATWRVLRGDELSGSAHGLCRPDGRWFVSVDTWDDDELQPLVEAMAEDLRHDLYTMLDEDDRELDRWLELGFAVRRREVRYRMPVDPARTGLATAVTDLDVVLLAADVVDEALLRRLDDELRTDVPGAQGWRNDPEEFAQYTFGSRQFDPATYLVAVDDTAAAFAGLVRVWNIPTIPRLGLIGVTRAYRRRGLARVLLGAAFAALHERGVAFVDAEVDGANAASIALLTGIGAVPTGANLELIRPYRHT